jgi:hypothetical protein
MEQFFKMAEALNTAVRREQSVQAKQGLGKKGGGSNVEKV